MNRQNIQQMILNSREGVGIDSNSGMAPPPPANPNMMPMISRTGDIDSQQLARARIEYENQFGPGSFPEQAYLDAKRNEAISRMPDINNNPRFSGYDPDPTSGTTPITPEGPANRYDINQASPEQMRAMQEQIGGPGFNSPPRFASANNESSRWMVDAPMGFNGGQPPGLLDKQFSRTMGAGSRQGGLLTQPPNANGSNSAQTGYDKNAGWAAAGKIMSDFGLEYMREDPFGDRGR